MTAAVEILPWVSFGLQLVQSHVQFAPIHFASFCRSVWDENIEDVTFVLIDLLRFGMIACPAADPSDGRGISAEACVHLSGIRIYCA